MSPLKKWKSWSKAEDQEELKDNNRYSPQIREGKCLIL